MEVWIKPIIKGRQTFGSEEYLQEKAKFMQALQDVFPSEYWKEALSVSFDNKWLQRFPFLSQKLDPFPIDFVFKGAKLGRYTFQSKEMRLAKREFFQEHGRLIRSAAFDQTISIAFDCVWLGKKVYKSGNLHGLYTPGLFCL
jgi:hypothetical protein